MFLYENEEIRYGIESDDDDEIKAMEEDDLGRKKTKMKFSKKSKIN
jgi:hypothetical protein